MLTCTAELEKLAALRAEDRSGMGIEFERWSRMTSTLHTTADPVQQFRVQGWTGAILPTDAGCGRIARKLYEQIAASVGLPDDLAYDATVAVSELATNYLEHGLLTVLRDLPELHADHPAEIWIYGRRLSDRTTELVCKIYDPFPSWQAVDRGPVDRLSIGGRGLQLVESLADGRWGHHPTTSCLHRPGRPGKAVWFAVSAPPSLPVLQLSRWSADGTADLIERCLADRSIRCQGRRTAVDGHVELMVRANLTVHCHKGYVDLPWPDEHSAETVRTMSDLHQAVEDIVQAQQEELCRERPSGL